MSNLTKFAVGTVVTKRQGIGYLHAGLVGKVLRHLDEGDIIEVDWQDPSLNEPCVRQYRADTIHKYVTMFIPDKKMVKTVRNILTRMTKLEWDSICHTGQREGFSLRATGRTTATALAILSESMRDPRNPVTYMGRDHHQQHDTSPHRTADHMAHVMADIIIRMGYKGFVFHTGNKTVTFNPFEEVEIEV